MAEKIEEVKAAAQARALELSAQINIKVHALVFMAPDEEEPVVGFVKEPSRAVKMSVMDKSLVGMYSASGEMLDVILLKEFSDSRIYSERAEDDKYYLGAVMAVYELIKVSVNVADKKK